MIQTNMAFTYRPLNPANSEIRLLEVSFDTSVREATLRYHLKHVSLNEAATFRHETISYCWGDPTPSASIMINDAVLKIPGPDDEVQSLNAIVTLAIL